MRGGNFEHARKGPANGLAFQPVRHQALRNPPGVDDADAARFEIAFVSGHDMQAMTEGGCGEETIGRRNDNPFILSPRGQFAPKLRSLDVEADDPVGEPTLQSGKPGHECVPFLTSGEEADPLGDFAERKNADIKLSIGNCVYGRDDRRIRRRLSQFGEGAGIEERFQSSTFRIGLLSRSRSSPSRDGPDMRKSLKL